MSGLLYHSPGFIIRQLLVDLGLGNDPPSSDWPIYSDDIPASPDNLIVINNSAGIIHGREFITGEVQLHHGVQVIVRSTTVALGDVKARAIYDALSKQVNRNAVTIDTKVYCIHSVAMTSDVMSLGKETPTSKRCLFSLNAIVHMICTS